MDLMGRDFNGIFKLPTIQLISPYKINYIRVGLEIPLQSLLLGAMVLYATYTMIHGQFLIGD